MTIDWTNPNQETPLSLSDSDASPIAQELFWLLDSWGNAQNEQKEMILKKMIRGRKDWDETFKKQAKKIVEEVLRSKNYILLSIALDIVKNKFTAEDQGDAYQIVQNTLKQIFEGIQKALKNDTEIHDRNYITLIGKIDQKNNQELTLLAQQIVKQSINKSGIWTKRPFIQTISYFEESIKKECNECLKSAIIEGLTNKVYKTKRLAIQLLKMITRYGNIMQENDIKECIIQAMEDKDIIVRLNAVNIWLILQNNQKISLTPDWIQNACDIIEECQKNSNYLNKLSTVETMKLFQETRLLWDREQVLYDKTKSIVEKALTKKDEDIVTNAGWKIGYFLDKDKEGLSKILAQNIEDNNRPKIKIPSHPDRWNGYYDIISFQPDIK